MSAVSDQQRSVGQVKRSRFSRRGTVPREVAGEGDELDFQRLGQRERRKEERGKRWQIDLLRVHSVRDDFGSDEAGGFPGSFFIRAVLTVFRRAAVLVGEGEFPDAKTLRGSGCGQDEPEDEEHEQRFEAAGHWRTASRGGGV